MVSKNNKILHLRKSATKVSKYKIKKLSVGVASVLVGATFFLGSTTSASASDEQLADKQAGVTQQTDQNATNTNDRVLKFDNATSTATTDNADSSAAKMSNVAQADNSANNATVANNIDKKSITDSTLSNNNDLKSTEMQSTVADQAAADDANTADQTATEKQATVTNQATVDNTVNTADQATQAAAEKTTTPASTAANTQAAAPVATLRAAATADTSTTTTVNNWTGLINALNNPYYQTITVDGTINAMGTGTVEGNDRTVVIKGADQNASIDFGSTPLTVNGTMQLAFENLILKTASANGAVTFNNSSNTSTVTFKDVTHSGASLYGGSGNAAVVIDGTTTSTVSTSSKPTAKTYSANGNGANIWGAKSVTVADGANFTLNRSAIGDGINLPDGATVQVGDNATMTVNLNTDNGTESARYHDAGIFMLNGGNFLTGRNAIVNMNTSIGQAVSIGADRPGIGVTAADRFGGYGTSQSRNAGPTAVTFGDYSQFNFTGRDGFILGNNANFTSGEYSNVHFQNQGRGVALDLANNSNIVISKHSNTLFESNGKTKVNGTPSGSYDGYNYIGVNEGGNITVDEYATFRVIMAGRGDNDWDDVVSLDSRKPSTNAAFTSKKGAIVDIRDDNTNFYAELISFPLPDVGPGANSVIDIQDPLYLNLQRYSAGGATTGWMPVGGTDINSTSDKYTANLIYMAGSKGVLQIGGTSYVVYQQIKSDETQQIWLNVDSVEFDKEGFTSKDTWNNGANADVSISGTNLTAGVPANNIRDNGIMSPTSPALIGKPNGPYYGISTMRASHQIWFPHSTEIQAAGQHQNIIKYVYEDGTEAAPTVTQTVDMTRDITLDLTADQIEAVKSYAATHSADETLNYIKDLYVVSQDSGWQVAEGINTKTAYDAVATPEIAGYTASIKSTNANGVTVGDDAATVHAILDVPAGTVVSNGKLSETYLNNGGTVVMPANYETVVVYQKEIQNQPVTIIYQDKSENNKILATDELEGKPGTALDYSTADKIQSFIDKGYKLVSDGVPNNATFGDEPETYYVTLEHDIAPVGPNNPHEPGTPVNPNDPDGPQWPNQDQYTKDYTSTVEFVDDQGNKMPGLDDNVQTSTWTRTLNVDKVTGDILNPAEPWTPDKSTYDKVNVPVVPGYYADQPEVPAKATVQENITDKVVYKPMGKIIPVDPSGNPIPDAPTPQYPNDPTDPTKTTPNQPVPSIPGMTPQTPVVTPENPGKDTPVVYNPVVEKHSLTERFVDEAGNELAPSEVVGKDYVKNDKYNVTGDAKVIEGYYLTAVPSNAEGTFGDDNVTVTFTYAKLGKIIPVDPSGNPIPDAPTPQYPNDPTDPTKTTPNQPVPEIPGMTPEVPAVTPENPGKDTKVVYEMNKHSLTERFVDEAGNELEAPVVVGTDYVKNDKYNVTGDAKVIDGYYLTAVPSNAEGTFGDDNVTVTFTYAKLGKIIPVDPSGNPIPGAETPQYPNDPNDPTKTTPNQPVPEIPGMNPEVPAITPNQPGEDTPVVYVPVVEGKYSLIERFVDEAGQEISSTIVKGTEYVKNDKYNVTDDAKVIDGYYLTAVPSNAEGTFGDDNVTVTFTYAKLGKIIPVDPSGNPIPDAPTPQYPNDPTSPTKTTPNQPVPEIPGMTPEVPSVTPENPGKDTPVVYELNKHSLTERFVDEAGNELAPSEVVGKDYVKDQKYNVTGDAKVIDGYYLTAVPSNAEGTFGDDNVTVTFTYAKLGKIIPVDPSGNPIPDAPTPQYPNDPTNPTKTTPNQPVPEIPGMTPEVPSVTPENPGKDTPVVYELNKHSLTERFVDEAGNELAPSEVVGKDYVKDQKYNVTGDAKVIDGYYLTAVPSNAEGTFGDDNVTVTFTYAKLGKIIPVDPSGNPIPDAPTPQYPNDPTNPTKTTPNQPVPEIPGMTPEVPSVTPENPGKDTPVVYELNKHSLTERFVDEAGNELAPSEVVGKDYVKDQKYNVTGDAKVIDGYYLTAVPSNAEGTFGDDNVTVTFTYAKLGKIIPVDPSGNPIPDAPTPQYPNDPTNPTKTTPNQPVPEIPGMTPEVPSVTPENPGKDTPVTYVPVVPEKQLQTAKIVYVDTKTGKTLETDTVTGKSGEKIDYSTTPRIDEWRDKGYRLVEDGFAEAGTPVYDDNDAVEQIFIVKLDHDTAPVGPNDPHEPGTPINPNDPNGPKWPAKDSYTKQYTSTVHFIDENGNKLHDDNVQTSTWTRTLIVDKATGEILNPDEAWHSDIDKYSDVKVDPIKGYYTDRKSVPGEVAQQQDIVNTVVYKQIGKIVPVDPSGNPIPDAPTPQYPNDPTDPTKTTPNQPVPEIPGMIPEVPAVTPENPGQDTPVVYNPVVEKYSLTERFVDEAGNELEAPVVKGTDYVKNDKYNVTGDAKVIEGYYLTAIPSNAEGTIGDENVTVTFTYAKLGKIVPVDPSGNPIPDAPTPQYRNDPNDPTKVIVTNTPEIPGMTPEVPSVTPENPGEDTPVVYNKVETPTPKTVDVTPETPKTVDVTSETPKATPVKTAPQVEKVKAPELPQTGEKQNNALTAVGASIMTGLLGILAFAKKKKDDKEI